MNRLLKQALVSFALIAVSAVGVWATADAGQLAFNHSAVTAEACGGGCQPVPPSCDIWVNPTSMQGTGDVTIHWDSNNAASGTVSNGDTTVDLPGASGDMPVYGVSETTTFVATVYNAYGDSAHCSATVTVAPPPQLPTCTLSAQPSTIVGSGDVTLVWDSHNAVSGQIDHGVGDLNGAAGDVTIHNVSQTTTYTGRFLSSTGESVLCSDTVTVTPPPEHPTCTLRVDPSSLVGSGDVTITWDSHNAVSGQIDHGVGDLNGAAGHVTIHNVSQNTTYTGRFLSSTGESVLCSDTVTVTPPQPQNGCIIVHKEAFDPSGNPLTSVPQFSFTLDGGTTLSNNSSGIVRFDNVTPGNHTVAETPGGAGWTSITALSQSVSVGQGSQCAALYFKNKQVVTSPNPVCQLFIRDSVINSGGSTVLSWTSSNVTSGSINNNVGDVSANVSSGSTTVFPPSSTTYLGTFTGPNGTVTCTIPVTVRTIISGCVPGTCPGGLNPPNVSFYQRPNEQPLAFVSLAEIPYTGFEAGPALTMIFWLAIALLSALIAYGVVGKDATRFALAHVLGAATGIPFRTDEDQRIMTATEEEENKYGRPYPAFPAEEMPFTPVNVSVAAPARAVSMPAFVPAPAVPVLPVSAPTNAILDVIESRAHAAGVLMSPEAAALATELSPDRDETLRAFGEILDDAVHTIPREDGWIMLTADRLHDLSEKHPVRVVAAAPLAPSLAPIDESAANAFAGAVASGDRDSAFSIVRSLEHDGVKPTALMTATATVLDKLYRARHGGKAAPDATLAEKASHLSDEELERLVGVFTHALDHVYASPFTGVKLALAQAFEVVE